ncbi:hypothetical protein ACQ4LE_002669 [Meloidogyne hapla]|uniref:Nodal modulator 1 n=1 Tax=Meloidogyne hapla TaxID=6305 RepID=A0A1I8BU81_MELHA
MFFYFLKFYLIVFPFFAHKICANVISCEGFVKSNIQIDYSEIKIKLYTSQGNLKYEAECNPQNGYFLIPIYSKGEYLVKIIAPDGYVFDPEFHEIEVIGENGCSKELNFNLSGLKISGTILNGKDTNLVLGLSNQDGKLIGRAVVDEEGNYNFVAKPGKYEISPISGSTQCLSQGSVKIELGTVPMTIKPDIRIEGHSLAVKVKDEEGESFRTATVILQSDKEIKFENLPINSEHPQSRNEGQKWFYEFKTDLSGSALINCLPPGKYILNAKQKFFSHIEPLFDERIVEMNSKTPEIKISINSFNLFGNVFTAKGPPLEDVTIKLDGESKTKSDKEGKFILTNVSPGNHFIEADKEHFEFNRLDIDVSSKIQKRILFVPIGIAICGQVLSADKIDGIKFEVSSPENNKTTFYVYSNFEGKFCQMFTPLKYKIKPISSMFLYPSQIEIDLSEGPILDLKFIQYKAKITGTIYCFNKKCVNISIKLLREDGEILNEIVNLDGTFLFKDVLPAKYKIKIFDEQNIWWENNEKDFIVQSEDINDINFTQKGYLLSIQTSKSAHLRYWPATNKELKIEDFHLKEGENQLYFEKENNFSFSIDSCYEFKIEGTERNLFKIPSKIPIILTAIGSSVSGFIKFDALDDTIGMKLREKSTNDEIIPSQIYPSTNGKMYLFFLDFSKIGNKYEFIPQSVRLLFKPKLVEFEFNGECEGVAASFISQMGKFIEGKVEPLVEDAFVKAIHKTDKNEVLTTNTDKKGLFSIGPVWKEDDFDVEIIKEGFIFVKMPGYSHSFTSIKLTQLRIQFLEEKTNKPLSDILVSISGGLDFRSNNITNESGLLKFIGLTPGSYFIRPILQEYKFNTSSFSIQINEGEEKELILEAKRIAFSAFGKVSTIGSRPFKVPIRVEAISAECENHQEEDLIDQHSGDFRIKGLKPQCNYIISLKDNDGSDIAAFPPLIDFIVGTENKIDLNFLILPSERPSPIVIGEIEIEQTKNSNGFRVVLLEDNNAINEQLIKNPSSIFIFNLPNYKREYSIIVDSIDSKQSKMESVSVNFFANSQFNYVRILPKSEHRSNDSDVRANYYGLVFILILTLAFLNQSKVKLLLEYILLIIQNFIDNKQIGIATINNLISDDKKRKIKK